LKKARGPSKFPICETAELVSIRAEADKQFAQIREMEWEYEEGGSLNRALLWFRGSGSHESERMWEGSAETPWLFGQPKRKDKTRPVMAAQSPTEAVSRFFPYFPKFLLLAISH